LVKVSTGWAFKHGHTLSSIQVVGTILCDCSGTILVEEGTRGCQGQTVDITR